VGFLYINSRGTPWRKHSYSAGNTFDQCPLKYKLQKIEGWKEKDNKARFLFGRAFENAVQWYHEHDGNRESAVQRFCEEWQPHVFNKDLQYTKVEKDWPTCRHIGIDWLKLYFIRQPGLPIPLGGQTLFQREVAKEVFPGDPTYGEIEDAGKLDIVAYVHPEHPLLPKLNWKPEYGPLRPVIVDIKTAGQDFPDAYGLAAYDTQLRRYSWLSGIRDVGLLWFTKKSLNVQKGSTVTLLENAGIFVAGQEVIVIFIQDEPKAEKPTKKDPNPEPEAPPIPVGIYVVANESLVEQAEKAQGFREGTTDLDTTIEAKERKYAWIRANATRVEATKITKQRLQFNAGYVTVESANDAGEIAARQIINIVNAWKRNVWPNTFGIRYPHDDRGDAYFQAFVLDDEKFRDTNFKKVDEESLDELFADNESEVEQ
jgi:hypothetical protein